MTQSTDLEKLRQRHLGNPREVMTGRDLAEALLVVQRSLDSMVMKPEEKVISAPSAIGGEKTQRIEEVTQEIPCCCCHANPCICKLCEAWLPKEVR